MRKQMRGYFRKSLCGMLSAAMIATSLIVPNMTVYAAPQDEAGMTTENEEDMFVDESTGAKEEGEDKDKDSGSENPSGGVDGDNGNVNDGDDQDGSSETGDSADEVDKENPDGEANLEDGDDVKDDEETAEDEAELEEVPEAVMAPAAADSRSSDAMQFYFYYEPEEDEADGVELGVEIWGTGITTSLSDDDKASWNSDYYLMESVKEYSNWYKIGLTISDTGFKEDGAGSDAGFNIHKKVKDKNAEKIGGFSGWANNNEKIYEELLGEKIVSYAVKDWKGYANDGETDLVTAIMRQVTLHVYDDKGTPSIAYKADDFSYINSEGKKENLTASKEESWAKRYDFSVDEGKTNWYHLTFIVPESFGAEDIQLYTKDSTGTYEWLVNFTEENFADVFKGKVYYKDGTFSDAIEDETQADGDITFYYYLEDAADGEEIGLYCKDSKVTVPGTANAKEASWTVNASDKVYLLEKVTGYAGWYSIPIHLEDTEQSSGFAIYVKSASGTPKVEYSKSVNGETYAQIVGGKNKTCAYKKGISYIGTDEAAKVDKVAAIMRNITLNVYSEDVIPAIQLDGQSAAKKLSVINEEDGSISDIEPSGQDDDKNNVYEMQKLGEDSYWFTLSFSAPGAISFDGKEKICGLYEKEGYSWLKNLMNGPASDVWNADFTPVFDGNIWCKYEHGSEDADRKLTFYATQEEAEAVTLAQLNELLNSDEVKAIVAKGEAGGYTEDSWKTFTEIKAMADQVADESKEEGKDPTQISSPEIKKVYDELKGAIDALKSLDVDVTFYYYAGETEDEIGLYYWDNSETKSNISSTAEKANWSVWGDGDTYLMTKVEGYAGWYSIPIKFKNSGADAGFQIYTKTKASSTEDNYEYKCDAGEDGHKDVYEKLVSGDYDTCAVKKDMAYVHATKDKNSNIVAAIMRQVTLHVYDSVDTPYLHMGDAVAATLSVVNETNGTLDSLESEKMDGQNAYALQKDAEYKNWYEITFSAPGSLEFDSKKVCNLYTKKSEDADYAWAKDFMNGSEDEWGLDFTPVFAGKTYYKDGTFYVTLEEADPDAKLSLLDKLRMLIKEAEEYKQEDYKETGWKEFTDALAAAVAVAKAADDAENDETGTKTAPTDVEIQRAYDDLKAAMIALIPASIVQADIKVDKVPLADDFITGADLSSYISLKESGVEFKDEKGNPLSDDGFFKYLYDGGTNWVRIRVWNDPYNSSGKGYGGGNNDLEKAKTIGKLATDAGMRVLIDFHYSDFWADPAKQDAPKAWKAYSVDEKVTAVHDYTLSSLQSLKAAGVDVGMVQVGNETNNGICGEKTTANMIKIFNAGSSAVRDFDPSGQCLVVIHFTNPEKGNYASVADKFATVDYDVFATSYYPFWHGTTGNLTEQLGYVAAKGKKVMVAETSWVTTWDDGDGHENTAPRLTQDLNYDISLQGQADEIRDVVAAAAAVGDNSIGVFYWEPAWISPYYVYDEDGNRIDSLYKQNQTLWEQYGSGWASSYSAEYDPGDAGKWYGGSAIDNQSWFDFDGTALATAKIYSLIRTGAEAGDAITSVESNLTREVVVGNDFTYPQVTAKYNYKDEDGTPHTELLDVTWDEDEKKLVNLNKMGEYVVHGTVSDGTKDYKVTLTIKVIRKAENNVLVNPGFEVDGTTHTGWTIDPSSGSAVSTEEKDWKENPRSGSYAMNFWFEKANTFTVSQTVTPEAGTYSFGGYIQGDEADVEDVQYIFAEVYGKDGTLKSRKKASFTLNGWRNWSEPEIMGITVSDGDTVKVGAEILTTVDGAWGSLDDFYLYGTHSVTVEQNEGGTVATSVLKANSGEKVNIAVTPDSGYYLKSLAVSGASITGDNIGKIFTSDNGTVAFQAASGEATNAAVLTYPAETTNSMSESFTMPNGNVTVSATFVSVFDESAEKISLDAQSDDKYLVQVNGSGDENPIEDQYYTGKNITPEVELSYKGYKLTSQDYTIKYTNNKDKTTADKKATITLTAKGERFTGTRTILFNIIDDPRTEEFKNLKVTFVKPDKGDGSTPAKSTYYLGKQKELTPEIVLKDGAGNVISNPEDKPVYKVFYQNNKKLGKATVVVLPTDEGLRTYKEGSVTTTFMIAKCPVNYGKVDVSIAQPNQYYTGKKVEPAVNVKLTYTDNNGVEKTTTLTKGTDYTVSYSNNTNATQYMGKDAEGNSDYVDIPNKVASIKITGKGNFTGTRTTYDLKDESKAGTDKIIFKIKPRSIDNVTITAADLAESASGTVPKLTVKDGTKTVASSQYMITKIVKKGANGSEDTTVYIYEQTVAGKKQATTGSNKLKDAGTYVVTVAGKNQGNYTGEKTVQFEVKGKEYLISNAKITVNGKFYFTGSAIRLKTTAPEGENPELKVVAGSGKNTKTLTEGTDYTVNYENNINAGKATITITGTGEYVGKKTATFTIGKRALAAGLKEGNEDKEKLTKGVIQTPILSKKNIETQLDGTWTVDAEGNLINKDNTSEKGTLSIPYTGYTLNPEFTFRAVNYIGAGTTAGKDTTHDLSSNDYTVTYSVGKWVEEKDENGKVIAKTAPVTATVKGKGNYSGSVKIPNMFTLTARDLQQLNIEVNPTSYDGGKALKPSVTFSKQDGTVVDLKLGTAYTVTYKNNKLATLLGLANDKKPKVTVKVKGNGWITDRNDKTTTEWETFFSIDQQEIVEADVADIAIQTYKGKALTPTVTVKVNGKKLKAGTDYTVTYSNNTKRTSDKTIGTVTITGKGNYFTRNPITMTFVIK